MYSEVVQHALAIPEIVSDICDWLDDDLVALSVKTQTLSHLARTSRIFHEPAIRILWRELPSLKPLVNTLPSNLCDKPDSNETNMDTARLVFVSAVLPSGELFY